MSELVNIIASQLGTIREMQIRQSQREAMQDARAFQQQQAVSYMSGAPGIGVSSNIGRLNLEAVPEHVDQAQAFVARQLVAQAQSDYRVAVERGKTAAADAARQKMETAIALEEAAAHRARADRAEAQLRKLRPQLLARLIPDRGPGSYELKPPWLWASWALVIAGVVVCAL